MTAQTETASLFARLKVGDAVTLFGADLVPLFWRGGAPVTDALLLEEALADGQTVVTEVSEGGVVGQVRVLHRGQLPLLVVQGEQILGAKQNRTFNASFVVAPGQEVTLPVSCVEQGRWQHRTAAFQAGATTISPKLRSRMLGSVSQSIRVSGVYDANQREVWSGVQEHLAATGTHSLTASYEDARQSRAAEVEQTVARVAPHPEQTGLAVVQGGRVVVLDVFGSPQLFARAFKKCLRGALSEVGGTPQPGREPAPELVKRTLAALAQAEVARARSPGSGETWSGQSASGAYTAAIYEGAVYHCAAAG